MKIAALMDPLDKLYAEKDSTLAFLQRAKQMGLECFYFTTQDCICRDGQAFAKLTEIEVTTNNNIQCHAISEQSLANLDIILMRKDPPFTLEYIYATYLLELAEQQGVIVSNKPQSLRDVNEKHWIMRFPQCCPPTIISCNLSYLVEFWQQYKQVIFKPLDGLGGRSVFYVNETGQNLGVILETLTQNGQQTIMAQQYIHAIQDSGDKRILLVHGKPVPYALARKPKAGEVRGNLSAGGSGEVVALSQHDYWICEQIIPALQEKHLYFVGIDVIGNYLTEINITSPTCAIEINAATNLDITGDYLRGLISLNS